MLVASEGGLGRKGKARACQRRLGRRRKDGENDWASQKRVYASGK